MTLRGDGRPPCRHSGEGRKPRQAKGRSVCLSWMQGALVAFVGMTLRVDGRLLDRPLERGRPRPQKQAPTMPSFRRRPETTTGQEPKRLPAVDARGACCLRRHDAAGRWAPSGSAIGPRASSPAEEGSNYAVIPAKAGNHDRPRAEAFACRGCRPSCARGRARSNHAATFPGGGASREPGIHPVTDPGSLRVRGCGTDWSNLARNGARKAPRPLTSSASASA